MKVSPQVAKFQAKFAKDHPDVECMGCYHLRPMGIKCNIHRTESSSARILRRADEAGLVLTSTTRIEQVFEAERRLGLTSIVL